LEGVQSGERLLQGAVADFVFVDVNRVEQRLIEQASLFVVAASVELAWVLHQLEADLDEPGAISEVRACLVEPVVEALSLILDIAELGLDLRLGQGAVSGEVDEVLLAGVERLKLGLELLVE
jgi:hypothetical protein